MHSALLSVHGLKNELYSWVARSVSVNGLGTSYILCGVLVSVHGLKNELYSCAMRLFRFMD